MNATTPPPQERVRYRVSHERNELLWGTLRASLPTMLGDEEQTLYYIVPDAPVAGASEVIKMEGQVERFVTCA